MTYTQLKTEHCPPLDMLLSGKGYFPELDCSMRQWFTDGLQKGLCTPEERAECYTLSGACNAGIELCTPQGEFLFYMSCIPCLVGVCAAPDTRLPTFGSPMLPANGAHRNSSY